MSGVESAATVQPAIKDVQTLKANLKEQEKRARSENETEEVAVLPITDQQPPAKAQDGGEQRKRRKVSNPDGPTKPAEEPVLDGPLPPATEPVKSSNGAHSNEKDPSSAAPASTSPTKTSQSDQPLPADATTTTASSDENNKVKTQPAIAPSSSEVANEPVASKDQPLQAQKTDQEKPDAQSAHPEATKPEAAAPTEAEEKAPKTIAKPAEAVVAAAASS
ncbi:hypothetical protein PtA15_10A636 [Puccinia triticina]|uniref:Uncharacterized protein n=1 Tax=Puccinia triticina TaxID=208348 RepID=A0ABY7CXN7_9BASI|nr:uncharacterized protein PtA15_10A636 [Puccinia triticina]WAQ89212.1 hypothetical protein PtA15_10A636 [Puccinia triticina]